MSADGLPGIGVGTRQPPTRRDGDWRWVEPVAGGPARAWGRRAPRGDRV